MNDNAKKWVAALKSGEYKQTIEVLHREVDGEHLFCCLGVACKLAIEAGVEVPTGVVDQTESEKYHFYGEGGDSDIWEILPNAVVEWLGFSEFNNNGSFYVEGSYEDLTSLNDSGKTFLEIAAIIESEPEGLFQ